MILRGNAKEPLKMVAYQVLKDYQKMYEMLRNEKMYFKVKMMKCKL